MALEPAIAMLAGALLLAQAPTWQQALGIGLVVAAGVGATRGGRRARPAAEPVLPLID